MMRNDKIIIGITGGSGAGKTTVSDILRQKGIFVIDADKVAREVVEKGKPALAEIAASYDGVILPDGTLDRKKLGAIVFSDKEKLNMLNGITHKYITQRIHELIDGCDSAVCVVDGAALIESGIADECDAMCLVTAKKKIRANRIARRDGISHAAAITRIRAQKSDEEYMRRCGYVIYNNGDIRRVGACVDDVVNKIFKEYR